MTEAQQFVLLSLEGNIGSGKSTVLRKLKETYPEWIFVDEPVGEWLALKNNNGESLLEVFYKDKSRWSYTFQNAAVLYRYKKLRAALDTVPLGKPAVIVMERSIETDRQIFCRMLHKDGFIDDLEKKLYEDWFEHLNTMLPQVDGYIYINTGPELSFSRIAKRAREGESVIPLAYLQELEVYHKNWLFNEQNDKTVLDFTNQSDDVNTESIYTYVQSLLISKILIIK
jgi:deoxyadenosine/deoxycytidine kinase